MNGAPSRRLSSWRAWRTSNHNHPRFGLRLGNSGAGKVHRVTGEDLAFLTASNLLDSTDETNSRSDYCQTESWVPSRKPTHWSHSGFAYCGLESGYLRLLPVGYHNHGPRPYIQYPTIRLGIGKYIFSKVRLAISGFAEGPKSKLSQLERTRNLRRCRGGPQSLS